MHSATHLIATITDDRLREADTARLARREDDRDPAPPRRARRLRGLVARLGVAAQR